MREYKKPTLEVTTYKLAKVSICQQSDMVETEKIDWTSGVTNGVKNGLK